MKEIVLIICVIVIYLLGFIFIKRLSVFLDNNYKTISKEEEMIEPSCIILDEDVSNDELISQIEDFKKTHHKMKIFICDYDVSIKKVGNSHYKC